MQASAWLWPALVTDYVVFRKLRLDSCHADRIADLCGFAAHWLSVRLCSSRSRHRRDDSPAGIAR